MGVLGHLSTNMIGNFFMLILPALVVGECDPLAEPANGVLVDSVWVDGAKAIRCSYGYVPLGSGIATCDNDVWSETLECDEAVAMLVGGEEEGGYTDRVEIVSPSSSCMALPPLPHTVHGAAGGWVGGMAVVCGGEPEPFAMSSLCFAYSPEEDAWLESDPLPKVRADHCSVVMPDASVIVTGNYPETNNVNMAESSKLVVGDEGTLVWSSLPDMLLDRDDHGCSLVSTNGKLEVLVAGGPKTGSAEIFDPVSVNWRSVASMAHTDYG